MAAVSVVIPAKNEKDNIEPLVNEIISALTHCESYEIIYVDDGSNDGTFDEVQRLRQQGISQLYGYKHEKSYGQSAGIRTAVLKANGRLIVTLDADGQNDPADIPEMLLLAEQQHNKHFCIAGFRNKRVGDTKWKQIQSKIANRVRSSLLQDDTPDTGCGLKVYPRETFLLLPHFNHMHRFMPALIKRLDGDIIIKEVNHKERMAGISNYNMWNRLTVGLFDLCGVAWLQRRKVTAKIIQEVK